MDDQDLIGALPGPQSEFLSCDADVVVYGGAAGGGKSYALLLDPLRYIHNPGFRGVIFRRTYPQITEGGGLWDTAMEIYPRIGGKANRSSLSVTWKNGARISFRHLQYEQTIYSWQGAQVPWIGFDEGTHFLERQTLYLMSRNRSAYGIPTRMRLTCNPDPASWLAQYLEWWIDQASGYPIPEHAGVVRWLYRKNDENYWYPNRAEAESAHPDLAAIARPKSWTFIPAKLSDNAVLIANNPEYQANLLAQSFVERARLLDGNWRVTAADGLFRAEWFPPPVPLEAVPQVWKKKVRAWDFAATEQKDKNDPDWLVGVLMGQDTEGRYWVLDVQRDRLSPLKVKRRVQDVAERDGDGVEVVIEQEPGSAGKILASEIKAWLNASVDETGKPKRSVVCSIFRPDQTTGDKVTRAHPFSAACERGQVFLAQGPWLKAYLAELVQFPARGVHDDQVDASTTGFQKLARGRLVLAL
jgi:predicted phage terminase large subunit-like protein